MKQIRKSWFNDHMTIVGPVDATEIGKGCYRIEKWNPGEPHYVFACGKVMIVFSPTLRHGADNPPELPWWLAWMR